MINLSNLQFDQSLISNLQGINPYEIMSKLGLNKKDTDTILKGDFSPVLKEKPFIIDFSILSKNYGKIFNPNLIKYFLEKAKNNENLSPEERDVYKEAYNNFFKLVFKVATDGIFFIDKMEDECLLIQYDGNYFILIKSPEMNNIFYLKNTSNH